MNKKNEHCNLKFFFSSERQQQGQSAAVVASHARPQIARGHEHQLWKFVLDELDDPAIVNRSADWIAEVPRHFNIKDIDALRIKWSRIKNRQDNPVSREAFVKYLW